MRFIVIILVFLHEAGGNHSDWSERTPCSESRRSTKAELLSLRDRVKSMFYHAYDGYMNHAYPYDELRPLTCDGHDTWGKFSLTLIDTLDTLVVLGNHTEFRRAAQLVIESADFDIDMNVSVFETNIRVVGGLLSAHLLSHRAAMDLEDGWPCSGPLLRLAETVARKLLPAYEACHHTYPSLHVSTITPDNIQSSLNSLLLIHSQLKQQCRVLRISAFNTTTGMPYGTVNLRYGVPKGETSVTCTACIGTFIVEFGALSRLTGDPVFEKAARGALEGLWRCRSELNLVGNHVDVQNCKWTATDMGIGAGIDSYLEYLVKGSVLFDDPKLMEQFKVYQSSIDTLLRQDDWYLMGNMKRGSITFPAFTSLDAYWPGVLSLIGDFEKATKTFHNYYQVWEQYGALPEFYGVASGEPIKSREVFPLRPELIESAVYLSRATQDPFYHCFGIQALHSIETLAKTSCGYATVHNVKNHLLMNRMESFFLAETVKYLYLLFDTDNFLHNTGQKGTVIETTNGHCVIDTGFYVFNTEAHPIDGAAVRCCSTKKNDDAALFELTDNLDLLSILGISGKRWELDYDYGTGGPGNGSQGAYESLSCQPRPFTARFALDGETFDDEQH